MKICVLGDTHFGASYSLGRLDQFRQLNSRLIDFSNSFDYIVDYLITNEIMYLIICGDLFESRRPAAPELALFAEKISRLGELGIELYIAIGNHDIITEQKSITLDVIKSLSLPHIHIFQDIDTICIGNPPDAINVIFFPFRTRQMLGCSSNDASVNRLRDRLQYEINSITNNCPKILVGHFMLQGTILGNSVLENHAGEIVLSLDMFNQLDGAIFGHVHQHQIVQQNPLIAYIGSMERKDFGESKIDKFFLIIDNNLTFNFEKLPVRNLFDITIDQSLSKPEDITKNIINYLESYSKQNDMFGSIIRLNITANEKSANSINMNEVNEFKKKLNIHNCVSTHIQIASKRQLRKSTITEKTDYLKSFYEYLELEEDTLMREKMKELGAKIISSRGK